MSVAWNFYFKNDSFETFWKELKRILISFVVVKVDIKLSENFNGMMIG